MSISSSLHKFRSFGGLKLLRQYGRMGVLSAVMKRAWHCVTHGLPLKEAYDVVNTMVAPMLRDKYMGMIPEVVDNQVLTTSCDKVWICWLQGMDNAPEMVKVCYESVRRYCADKEIVLVDEYNYEQYISLPQYIKEKRRKGVIPSALFSDLLRLELLIKHGGTWIDSTVLMTDPSALSDRKWMEEIMSADLFMFQYVDRLKRFCGISNWFITARPDHWVLKTIRDVLYAYWKEYDCVLDYYIFHLAFGMIAQKHPDVIHSMPRRKSVPSLFLLQRLHQDYDPEFWNTLTSHVCFHKLNYRKQDEAKTNAKSYYMKALLMRRA